MALKAGTKLGVYEVTAQIGAGGMGEVYRARDTSLDRDVAIKVLPDAFATDTERLARFEREAKVLASLNHPNIAAIYGLEKSGETPALVLELVEGPTLQDRIAKGPIPLDEALPIARQIAEALEAAHEQGIIHRDLKPANVKVKDDGTVKVLDFGLAKALQPDLSDLDAANSPTMTMTAAATKMGVIMGTAAYMAPEQAKGRQVDKRVDIWAFGVVLYEMLTGRQAFGGTDISETLASVLKTDLNLDGLPADTPRALRRALSRCIQKDRSHRSRDIGDVRLDLDEALAAPVEETVEAAAIAQPALWQRPMSVAAIVLAAIVVTALAVWTLTRPAPAPVTRMSIVLPRTQVLTSTGRRGVAISPMGTHVVYVANRQLYLRALDELEAQPLTGTEASNARTPFFSPDGQWIGFFSGRVLKKVALSGGAAVTLTEADSPYGASWGADDTILFGQGGQGILRVAGAGGTPDVLVSVESPNLAHQPQMLPGGEAVLYTLGGFGLWDAAQIVVEQVATGERTVLVEGGSDARYLPTGHLVYALGGTLLAVPFDVDRLMVTGGPVPLVEGVSRARAGTTGAAHADIARTGALVYLPSGATGGVVRTLVWVDRDGIEEALGAPPRAYALPRLSPDGTRVALDVGDDEDDVWVWDLTRETLTRLTFAAERDGYPVWTPDGQRVVFESHRAGEGNLFAKSADGTGAVEHLTESPTHQSPLSMSPDGEWIVFEDGIGDRSSLALLPSNGESSWELLLESGFNERNGEISPDGQWLAYQTNASGQDEIYVQPFPDVDAGRWQISTTGGTRPLWGPDGRELFYMTEAGVMGVTVETDAGFEPGTPGLVVEGFYFREARGRTYDIAPDGQRFLMIKEGATVDADDPFAGLTQIVVVQNWHQELLERVPVP